VASKDPWGNVLKDTTGKPALLAKDKGMNMLTLADGQSAYSEYDEIQDMLYITFASSVGPTYYSDIDELDGVMLRYDGKTDEAVGVTVHNVKQKMYQQLVEDICRQVVHRREHAVAS
jgi:hypothetical protein